MLLACKQIMPPGKKLTAFERRNIWNFGVNMEWNGDQIFEFCFEGDERRVSLFTIQKHLNALQQFSESELKVYLAGPKCTGGRPPVLDDFDLIIMEAMMMDRTRSIREFLSEMFPGVDPLLPVVPLPSRETVRRSLVDKLDFSCKVAERIHVGRNNADRAVFLDRVAAIEEHRWIDIDETAASAAEFEAKYGWAPRGRACNFQQFVIDNRRFSAVAAYTTLGFLCWRIVEGTFDSGAFMEFVNNELALSVWPGCFSLIDNARIHKGDATLNALDNVFDGCFFFSPVYSPGMKPIELGFASVKRFLRLHEVEAVLDPVAWLDRAFQKYSILGDSSCKG